MPRGFRRFYRHSRLRWRCSAALSVSGWATHGVPYSGHGLKRPGSFSSLRVEMHGPTGQLTDRLNFVVPERPSIGLQQVVKPYIRNLPVWVIPRVPREVGLGLPGDQSPIERTNLVALRIGRMSATVLPKGRARC